MLCGSQNIVLNGKVSARRRLPCPAQSPRFPALSAASLTLHLSVLCLSLALMLTAMASSAAGGSNLL